MPDISRDTGGAASVHILDEYRPKEPDEKTFHESTGNGGGPPVDTETQRYVDKSLEAVKAQNDTRFESIDMKLSKLDDIKVPSIWAFVGIGASSVIAIVGLFVAILAFGGDRFDGGLGVGNRLNPELERQGKKIDSIQSQLKEVLSAIKESGKPVSEKKN